jgi:hypothetical protein
MKLHTLSIIALVTVVAGAGLLFNRARDAATKVEHQVTGKAESLPVDAVLSVRPGSKTSNAASSFNGRLPATQPTPVVSAELRQFREHIDYAGLYAKLSAGPETPEALYLKAAIYARCGRQGNKSTEEISKERDAQKTKFLASIQPLSENARERASAFEKLSADPCAGLDLGKSSQEALKKSIDAAADAGDPRARAWQLVNRVEGTYLNQGQSRQNRGYELNEADFETARALLGSGDPDVILDLRGILSSTLTAGQIYMGDTPVDLPTMNAALELFACDAGAPCGRDSEGILMACAYRGQCAAGDLYEHSAYYRNSPSDSQQIDQYRQALYRMWQSRDFSGLQLHLSDTPQGYVLVYGGRRPGA